MSTTLQMATPPKATTSSKAAKAVQPMAVQPKVIAKFKVGDEVEYVGGDLWQEIYPWLVVGLQGKITHCERGADYFECSVKFTNGEWLLFCPDNFLKLVPPVPAALATPAPAPVQSTTTLPPTQDEIAEENSSDRFESDATVDDVPTLSSISPSLSSPTSNFVIPPITGQKRPREYPSEGYREYPHKFDFKK